MTAAVQPLLQPESWSLKSKGRTPSFVAGRVLVEIAARDPRVAVLTADLAYSNGTHEFGAIHPERFFNMGIAERNMLSVAAGMASVGLIPYVSTFASFAALLCAEQIRTDLAYPSMKVRVLAHHAGFSLGYYGTSHHATEDVGMLRPIAGLTIVAVCDAASLVAALRQTIDTDGPVYFRLGRGRDPDVYGAIEGVSWELGKPSVLREGSDLTLLAYGATVAPSLWAAEAVRESEGVRVKVVDVHTLKPLNAESICSFAATSSLGLLVAEEHNVIGGLASAVADCLVEGGMKTSLRRLGVPDEYVPVGPPSRLYHHYRLDGEGIAAEIRKIAGTG